MRIVFVDSVLVLIVAAAVSIDKIVISGKCCLSNRDEELYAAQMGAEQQQQQ